MKLTPEKIQANWEQFLNNIQVYVTEPRLTKLLGFYNSIEEIAILAPASANEGHHSAYPGGYVVHVNNVVSIALDLDKLWNKYGGVQNHTTEELVFACINHDLGKLGTGEKDKPYYIQNPSEWHVKNQGKIYTYNEQIPYTTIPDRSLFILQKNGIEVSLNEMLAIKLHDGLYDPANESYLITHYPSTKPRSYLVHLVHQADMIASRIEFEQWYYNQQSSAPPAKSTFKTKQDIREGVLKTTLNKKADQFSDILNKL